MEREGGGDWANLGVDYASVVFAGFTAISAAWYFIRGRKAFTGPPIAASVEEEREDKSGLGEAGTL